MSNGKLGYRIHVWYIFLYRLIYHAWILFLVGFDDLIRKNLRQETPELVPDGETPQNVAIVVFDDLVNQVMSIP